MRKKREFIFNNVFEFKKKKEKNTDVYSYYM